MTADLVTGAGEHSRAPGHPHPVVAVLANGRRVIEDDIQWIIQSPRADGSWRSNYFCRTREGLLLYAGPASELLALPDRFPEA
jgi:hypothetical protein